jgi:2'-5' RNA ligase
MRLFLAVRPEDREIEELGRQLAGRRLGAPAAVRWLEPTAWHITMRFVGAWPQERLAELQSACARAVVGLHGPLRLTLSELGAFPKPSRATVLWIGAGESGRVLHPLAAAVEEAVRTVGLAPEQRPFRAHLTVARLKAPADLRRLLEAPLARRVHITIRELVLYESFTRPVGAHYDVRAQWPIGA